MTVQELVDACHWAEPGGREAAATILAFLDEIGIAAELGTVAPEARLAGLEIAQGRLRLDPAAPIWPGDLLHEAGHIAVTDAALRPTLGDPGSDPAQEMAAQAWSAAAAIACGVPLDVVFHEGGYHGHAQNLAMTFAGGNGPGAPMLAWYGMTAEPHRATPELPGFPVMQRWLR